MHAANADRSRRLGRTLAILRAHPDGLTNHDLNIATGAAAPKATIEQLERRLELVDQWLREAEDAS